MIKIVPAAGLVARTARWPEPEPSRRLGIRIFSRQRPLFAGPCAFDVDLAAREFRLGILSRRRCSGLLCRGPARCDPTRCARGDPGRGRKRTGRKTSHNRHWLQSTSADCGSLRFLTLARKILTAVGRSCPTLKPRWARMPELPSCLRNMSLLCGLCPLFATSEPRWSDYCDILWPFPRATGFRCAFLEILPRDDARLRRRRRQVEMHGHRRVGPTGAAAAGIPRSCPRAGDAAARRDRARPATGGRMPGRPRPPTDRHPRQESEACTAARTHLIVVPARLSPPDAVFVIGSGPTCTRWNPGR